MSPSGCILLNVSGKVVPCWYWTQTVMEWQWWVQGHLQLYSQFEASLVWKLKSKAWMPFPMGVLVFFSPVSIHGPSCEHRPSCCLSFLGRHHPYLIRALLIFCPPSSSLNFSKFSDLYVYPPHSPPRSQRKKMNTTTNKKNVRPQFFLAIKGSMFRPWVCLLVSLCFSCLVCDTGIVWWTSGVFWSQAFCL